MQSGSSISLRIYLWLLGQTFPLALVQVTILERRNNAGRVAYKSLEDPWSGSVEDNFILLDLLDQLRTNPGLLSSDAVLPDLNDELAPVSIVAGAALWSGLETVCSASNISSVCNNGISEVLSQKYTNSEVNG